VHCFCVVGGGPGSWGISIYGCWPQVFKAKGLRHPSAGLHMSAGSIFVPNDVQLGGGEAPFIILTGPNMGGLCGHYNEARGILSMA
jgi:hypothetical protein